MQAVDGQMRFCVAGLEVQVCSGSGNRELKGAYADYPSSARSPDLTVHWQADPDYVGRPANGVTHPGFAWARSGPQRVSLWRSDVDGDVDVGPGPVRSWFRGRSARGGLEAAVRISMSLAFPRKRALLVHASAIEHGGRAWVFAGQSGAGKSTIARLCAHRAQVVRLADELIVLSAESGTWRAHVAPFLAKVPLPHGRSAPVTSVCFLSQGATHQLSRLEPGIALRSLLRHVVAFCAEPSLGSELLELGDALVAQIPCNDLHFAKEPSVARVLGIA